MNTYRRDFLSGAGVVCGTIAGGAAAEASDSPAAPAEPDVLLAVFEAVFHKEI